MNLELQGRGPRSSARAEGVEAVEQVNGIVEFERLKAAVEQFDAVLESWLTRDQGYRPLTAFQEETWVRAIQAANHLIGAARAAVLINEDAALAARLGAARAASV